MSRNLVFPQKAIVPAAGYGTRFLPVTKAIPKEMLPIIDKPVIQYIVEQLAEAKVKTVIFITGWHKRAVEDHFDRHLELEQKLKESGKEKELKAIQKISNLANFVYIRQKQMRGNGDAILAAEPVIQDESFIVMWGDEIIRAHPPVLEQLKRWYLKLQAPLLTVAKRTDEEATYRYAFVAGRETESYIEVKDIIEKPGPKAPSSWAVFSPFIFTPDLFGALKEVKVKPKQELVYVDGLKKLIARGKKVYAIKIKNFHYHDCGNIIEYLKTTIALALERKDIRQELLNFLKTLRNNGV